jgi:hypothetical protein
MNEITLKSAIIEYARTRSDEWIAKGKFEDLARQLHFLGDNAGRRCRELVKSGLFKRRLNEQRCVEYKFINPVAEIIKEKLTQSSFI